MHIYLRISPCDCETGSELLGSRLKHVKQEQAYRHTATRELAKALDLKNVIHAQCGHGSGPRRHGHGDRDWLDGGEMRNVFKLMLLTLIDGVVPVRPKRHRPGPKSPD